MRRGKEIEVGGKGRRHAWQMKPAFDQQPSGRRRDFRLEYGCHDIGRARAAEAHDGPTARAGCRGESDDHFMDALVIPHSVPADLPRFSRFRRSLGSPIPDETGDSHTISASLLSPAFLMAQSRRAARFIPAGTSLAARQPVSLETRDSVKARIVLSNVARSIG